MCVGERLYGEAPGCGHGGVSAESYSVRPTASWLRQFPPLSTEETENRAAGRHVLRLKNVLHMASSGLHDEVTLS